MAFPDPSIFHVCSCCFTPPCFRTTSTQAASDLPVFALSISALVSASLVLGGLAGGATTGQLRSLAGMGLELGLAFQIHDDLLNRASSLARLGKRAGTDEAREKATYPRAVGTERARAEAARLFMSALRGVERDRRHPV